MGSLWTGRKAVPDARAKVGILERRCRSIRRAPDLSWPPRTLVVRTARRSWSPIILGALTGIPVGIVQWLVARRNLGIRIAWIPRTALGIAIVIFLPSLPDVVLVDFNVSLLRRALPFICVVHFLAGGIAGLGLGALQSLSAAGTPIADSPWIKFTVLGAALGSVVGLATFPDFYGVYSLYSNIAAVILDTTRSALMWAAIGISQSYALRRSRPSTR